jgi:hypothetical protein
VRRVILPCQYWEKTLDSHCCVHFLKKTIQVFDPLFENYESSVIAVFQYLKDACKHEHGNKELPNQDQWKLFASNRDIPGQTNGYDCGVFVCMYADYITNGWPLIFDQAYINRCRERIALGCMKNSAVTTKAGVMALNKVYRLKHLFFFNALHHREQFLAYIEKGKLAADDSMGMYHTSVSLYTGVGKRQFREEHFSNHDLKVAERKEMRQMLKEVWSHEWDEVKDDKQLATKWLSDNMVALRNMVIPKKDLDRFNEWKDKGS